MIVVSKFTETPPQETIDRHFTAREAYLKCILQNGITAQAKEAFEKDPISRDSGGKHRAARNTGGVGNGLYGTVLSGGSCGGCR